MTIGKKYMKEVAEKSRIFCQEMQMTPEQRNAFANLIEELIKYTVNTCADAANAVGGIRTIKKE